MSPSLGGTALALSLLGSLLASQLAAAAETEPPDIVLFFQAAQMDDAVADAALERIAATWRDDYAALLVDLARLMRPPEARRPTPPDVTGTSPDDPDGPTTGAASPSAFAFADVRPRPPEHPSTPVRRRLIRFLERQTGQRFGQDLQAWRRWYWNRPYAPHAEYRAFKGALYAQVDPRMARFFAGDQPAGIRLDEVDWGGVGVNGIPPLDHPAVVPADAARYLDDGDVVFGVVIDGAARAYPKRILAWHEMALDRLGGVDLAVVYCTLCGTVIPYESAAGDRRFTFGTSGLLYRSNKLMFDEETGSLWNTVEGRPVLGPLAGSGLELRPRPVVTTRWGEWRRVHPATDVLSLDTGHERDYSEGAAYREYFATDRLMFAVPATDDRLDNKAEVLALLLRPPGSAPGASRQPLAISAKRLRDQRDRPFPVVLAGRELVVVTSDDGANRVYETGGRRFAARLDGGQRLRDGQGGLWRVTEEALEAERDGVAPLPRVPARRAFWFGWFAQYPETELIR